MVRTMMVFKLIFKGLDCAMIARDVAGHETSAAVLTWAVFLLAQDPSKMRKAQEEIDGVLGQNFPTYESLKKLEVQELQEECISDLGAKVFYQRYYLYSAQFSPMVLMLELEEHSMVTGKSKYFW